MAFSFSKRQTLLFLSQNNGLVQVKKNRSFVLVYQTVVLGDEKQMLCLELKNENALFIGTEWRSLLLDNEA